MGIHKLKTEGRQVILECRGASLSDLFETAAQGIFRAQYDTSTVGFERELLVTAEAEDLQALMQTWLQELLTLVPEQGFIPGDFMVVEIGDPPTRRFGPVKMLVRAVTRGRMHGDWFAGVDSDVQLAGTPEISQRRRTFSARIPLVMEASAR